MNRSWRRLLGVEAVRVVRVEREAGDDRVAVQVGEVDEDPRIRREVGWVARPSRPCSPPLWMRSLRSTIGVRRTVAVLLDRPRSGRPARRRTGARCRRRARRSRAARRAPRRTARGRRRSPSRASRAGWSAGSRSAPGAGVRGRRAVGIAPARVGVAGERRPQATTARRRATSGRSRGMHHGECTRQARRAVPAVLGSRAVDAFELADLLRARAESGRPVPRVHPDPRPVGRAVRPAAGATDPQGPHTEDEVYHVVSGRARSGSGRRTAR